MNSLLVLLVGSISSSGGTLSVEVTSKRREELKKQWYWRNELGKTEPL